VWARIVYAARLAQRHGAHLIGPFMVPSLLAGSAAESFVMGKKAVREVIAQHRELETIELARRRRDADFGIGPPGVNQFYPARVVTARMLVPRRSHF
jgi:hypothetical protein